MLSRAPHIVQRFFMEDHPAGGPIIPGSRRSVRVADMATKVDGAQGEYILMDYCKFGNLESQLMKAAVDMAPNNTERWLPESVLWRMFDCLVKGCMAMQCPPRYVPGNVVPAPAPAAGAPVIAPAPAPAAAPVPLTALGAADLPEVVAPGNGRNAGHLGLVHFDLVGNVLIYPEPFNHRLSSSLGLLRCCSTTVLGERFTRRVFERVRFIWPILLSESLGIVQANVETAYSSRTPQMVLYPIFSCRNLRTTQD